VVVVVVVVINRSNATEPDDDFFVARISLLPLIASSMRRKGPEPYGWYHYHYL